MMASQPPRPGESPPAEPPGEVPRLPGEPDHPPPPDPV